MTEKQRGTADVTVVAWVDGIRGRDHVRDHLLERFATRARQGGTLVIVGEPEFEPAFEPGAENEPPGYRVRLRYRHTCKNQGNHEWDARRFFEKALDGDEHWGYFLDAHLNSWESAA